MVDSGVSPLDRSKSLGCYNRHRVSRQVALGELKCAGRRRVMAPGDRTDAFGGDGKLVGWWCPPEELSLASIAASQTKSHPSS